MNLMMKNCRYLAPLLLLSASVFPACNNPKRKIPARGKSMPFSTEITSINK
jgi:hypothetical protein